MPKFKDLTGKTFDRLYVEGLAMRRGGRSYWSCQCSCGNTTKLILVSGHLTSGNSKSCGCLKRDLTIKRQMTHNKSNIRLYTIWQCMKRRCYSPKHKQYKDYGGRGIEICAEWLNNFMSFYTWSINNGYDDNLTIDRENNDGNYEPSNCQWATKLAQAHNQRICRTNKSGIAGVSLISKADETNKWRARITVQNKSVHLGIFNTLEEAAAARKAAELKYW